MPESAEELYARVVAAVGEDGRLPMPDYDEWGDWFPWEVVDGELKPKTLKPPVAEEKPRSGLGGVDCHTCAGGGDGTRIWESWNFHLFRPSRPMGLPMILFLNSNEHLDFTDLDDEKAAEAGKLTVWLTRIISNLENVGRVHACRWGDGSEHMHTWFIARPVGFTQIIGSMAVEWNEMLPPVPEDVWLEDTATVARKLALHDGHALV